MGRTRQPPNAPARLRRLRWWPWLIAPAAIALLVMVGSQFRESGRGDVLLADAQLAAEAVAPFLVGAAVIAYALRAAVTRSPLALILVGLAASLLCREIHWEWTHRGIYALLAATGLWGAIWHRRIARPLAEDAAHTSWLLATLWAYALAFLLYRRAFRFLPGEDHLHNFLEEGAETVAHLMLIVTSLVGRWRRARD